MNLYRHVILGLALAVLALLRAPDDAVAQKNGNAHIMDVSLNADGSECIGTPDTLKVVPGDIVVFRAVGGDVMDVTWPRDIRPVQATEQDKSMNLTEDRLKGDGGDVITNTGEFSAGHAFAINVNKHIQKRTLYPLTLRCSGMDDAPPIIIVDP